MKFPTKPLPLAAAIALALCNTASAADIAIDTGDGGGGSGLSSNGVYQSFTTGSGSSTSLTLESISFYLYDTTGALTATIYAADRTTSLWSSSTTSSYTTTNATFDVTGLTLSANTSYWLMLSSTNSSDSWNSDAESYLTVSTFSGGDAWSLGDIYYYSSGWNTSTTDVQCFSISVSSVPEPATYAGIGGLAVLGFALMRKRRK